MIDLDNGIPHCHRRKHVTCLEVSPRCIVKKKFLRKNTKQCSYYATISIKEKKYNCLVMNNISGRIYRKLLIMFASWKEKWIARKQTGE